MCGSSEIRAVLTELSPDLGHLEAAELGADPRGPSHIRGFGEGRAGRVPSAGAGLLQGTLPGATATLCSGAGQRAGRYLQFHVWDPLALFLSPDWASVSSAVKRSLGSTAPASRACGEASARDGQD